MKRALLFLSMLFLAACSLPVGKNPDPAVSTAVAATLRAAQAGNTPGTRVSGPAGGLVPAGSAQDPGQGLPAPGTGNQPAQPSNPQGGQTTVPVQETSVPGTGNQTAQPPNPQGGQTSVPPVNSSTAISITSISTSPNQVYYGKNCATEPTTLTVTAHISPPSAVSQVTLNYGFTGSGGSSPAYSLPMQPDGNGEYRAQANVGSQAETYIQQTGGQIDIWVDVKPTSGANIYSNTQSVAITFCPARIVDPGGNAPPAPGGSQDVIFSNQTSYPLVSLVIDGVEQLPNEANAIKVGGSQPFQVSAGNHTYSAYNGWWEFGSRNDMYQWSGNFSDQQGSITFYNPTIQQLLTGFGNSRYFATGYMGDDMNWHNVGLCFYADGSFRYYDNSVLVDNGSYSEVSRSKQMVTVRLNAASETMDGLYYETFGLFDLPNGPGGTAIEYAPSGSCP